MSVATPTTPAPAPAAQPRTNRRTRMWIYLLAGFVLISLVRVISGANDVDSSGTLRAALESAIPIALAGLGGLWSERAGVVNIGLEGMMIVGTLGAGYFGYHYGWLAGILGAVVFGMLGGALHALATVTFGVDHIVSGVAINIIALGVSGFLAETFFSGLPGGGPTQSPTLPEPPTINLDFIADPAADLQDKHWFLVSELASVVGALTRELSLFTLFAVLLVVATGWVLWKTPFGLRLRSCGESPSAAETLGVNVYRFKFLAVVISGGLAGLGGAYLAMVAASGFQQGQTGGRGYIGLAAMIFGNWRPGGLMLGSTLFGYTNAMQLRSGSESLHALLLVVAVVLVAVAYMQLRLKNRTQAIVSLLMAAAFLLWNLTTKVVPREFTTMAPYVTTLLVLAFAAQQLRMPAADGQPYRKGQAG
jgi:simple sugar transport system permease protein